MSKNSVDSIDKEESTYFKKLHDYLSSVILKSLNKGVRCLPIPNKSNPHSKSDVTIIDQKTGLPKLTPYYKSEYQYIIDEPYFAHCEYDERESGKDELIREIIYIGENMIVGEKNSDILVYGWEADICNELYYGKRNKEFVFRHSDLKYKQPLFITPILRRNIHIKNGEYFGYSNEYVHEKYINENKIAGVIAGEQISDEFLNDILKKKKTDAYMSNIIKTIQQNQNEVIRLPYDQNIVVQGCAGSGKTMILLHRLSFLLKRNFIPENFLVYILTPSELFNKQLQPLINNLHLDNDKIIIKSTTAFYSYILNTLGWNSSYNNRIVSNDSFLSKIYSDDFLSQMVDLYNQNKTAGYLTANKLDISFFRECEKILNFTTIYSKSIIIDYNEAAVDWINKILSKNTEILTIHKEYNRKISALQNRINNRRNNLETLNQNLTTQRNKIYEFWQNIIKDCNNKITNYENQKIPITNSKLQKNLELKQLALFYSNVLPEDLPKKIELNQQKYLTQLNSLKFKYENILNQIKVNRSAIDVLISQINEIKLELNETHLLSNEKINKLITYRNELLYPQKDEKQTYTKDYKKFFDQKIFLLVKDLAATHHVTVNKYDHYMNYLRLQWYFINNPEFKRNILFVIDEAQNLSLNEYLLLKKIGGDRAIFNIYGDIYQNVSNAIGIQKWSEVSNVLNLKLNLYRFRENYRNTVSIIKKANELLPLAYKMKSIGSEFGITEYILLKDISNKISTFPENIKIVVIYKDTDWEYLKNTLNTLTSKNVLCLKLNEAKGLEFNTVFVYDENMSNTEKYLSYTRALENLFIILPNKK